MNRRHVATLLAALLPSLGAVAAPAAPALAAQPAAAKPAAAAAATEKEAEDVTKAQRKSLADKIAPVSGNLFTKKGRFEISPTVGVSLDDAFFQKLAFGAKLTYHVVESFSLGLHGTYSVAMASGAVNVCRSDGCGTPSMDELDKVPGKIGLLAGLDLAWSPIYGKVNVFGEKVLHFDTAVLIGGSVIQYQAPSPDGAINKFTGGFHFGIGERFVFSNRIALRLELRDYIYSATVDLPKPGKAATAGPADYQSKVQNQLMFELGLSFFVG